jgi:hypothetical protein
MFRLQTIDSRSRFVETRGLRKLLPVVGQLSCQTRGSVLGDVRSADRAPQLLLILQIKFGGFWAWNQVVDFDEPLRQRQLVNSVAI